MSNKKAWINSELFRCWFEDIFVKKALKGRGETEKILLILDNCSSHLNLKHDQIEILFLPPNVISTSQPLDQGIISTVKRIYRTSLLQHIVSNIQLFVASSKRQRKKSGLKFGGPPDMLDACKLLKESWNQITSSTISRCWIKSNLINPIISAELQSNNDTKQVEPESNKSARDMEDLCENIQNICIESLQTQYHSKKKITKQLENDIKKWIKIEEDPIIILPEVDELMKTNPEEEYHCGGSDVSDGSNDDDDDKKKDDNCDFTLNGNLCELEQARNHATQLIQFFETTKQLRIDPCFFIAHIVHWDLIIFEATWLR